MIRNAIFVTDIEAFSISISLHGIVRPKALRGCISKFIQLLQIGTITLQDILSIMSNPLDSRKTKLLILITKTADFSVSSKGFN